MEIIIIMKWEWGEKNGIHMYIYDSNMNIAIYWLLKEIETAIDM